MWCTLVNEVKRSVETGTSYKDHAVLAKNGATVAAAAAALQDAGIPTLYVGDLVERPEIKDLLAIIQLIVERSPRAMLRVGDLTSPKMRLQDVRSLMSRVADNPSLMRLGWLASKHGLSVAGEESRKDLCAKLEGFSWKTNPWVFICELLLERRFLLVDLDDESIKGHLCRLALWQFAYVTRTGDGDSKRLTLFRFLNRLRLRNQVGDGYVDRELPPEASTLNGVRVMTIHSSKGLEFHSVHLCGIHGNHFNGADDTNYFLPPNCINSNNQTHAEETQIERNNLLYVAVSRAKDALSLYQNTEEFPPKFLVTPSIEFAVTRDLLGQRGFHGTSTTTISQAPASLLTKKTFEIAYDAYLTYKRCPRQYLYRFEMELGRELSPNPSLHARSVVLKALEQVAKSGQFDLATTIFADMWNLAQLPPPTTDPQLWKQAELACKEGCKFLAALGGGSYVKPVAELNGISFGLPWGVGVIVPGGICFALSRVFLQLSKTTRRDVAATHVLHKFNQHSRCRSSSI